MRLGLQGGDLRVDVQDNGPGIARRTSRSSSRNSARPATRLTDKPQGTGLGLPISRQIIEHFGGRLWVDSEPGRGATFSFTLPLSEGSAQQLAA